VTTTPRRILVVEDEPDARDLLATTLAMHGHRVAQASSAEEAIPILDAERFDLVVADWDLPGRSGASLAVHVAQAGGTAPPVLIVTAHPEPSGV
jgi:two-component system response regulator PilR (NtrC family)